MCFSTKWKIDTYEDNINVQYFAANTPKCIFYCVPTGVGTCTKVQCCFDDDSYFRRRRIPCVVIIHIMHHFVSRICVPWHQLVGIGWNQGTATSIMMYEWRVCPRIGQTGAASVNTMTSMLMMPSCRKYHGLWEVWLEVPYPAVAYYEIIHKPNHYLWHQQWSTTSYNTSGHKPSKLTPGTLVRSGDHSFGTRGNETPWWT